jgi:heme/copper-type cytochrome/quinol oxidase subunit 2
MTGYSDAYTLSSISGALHVASDIKDEENGLLSGISTISLITMALVAAVVFILTAELVWRERRQRRQEEPTTPAPHPDSREGEISP